MVKTIGIIPINFNAQSEVAHTQEELTGATAVSTILRLDSVVEGSSMNQLPLQVLGEDFDSIAIFQKSLSTSPGQKSLDVSADSGSDIGADRQLVDYDSDSPDESQGYVFTDTRRKL